MGWVGFDEPTLALHPKVRSESEASKDAHPSRQATVSQLLSRAPRNEPPMPQTERYSSCACGQVRFKALGAPMFCAVCYCDDCQKGAGPLEALSGAPAFRDADGGTPYLSYRDDRFTCIAGEGLLEHHRIKPNAPTCRVVATCCNAAVFLKFGPGDSKASRSRWKCESRPNSGCRTKLCRRMSPAIRVLGPSFSAGLSVRVYP